MDTLLFINEYNKLMSLIDWIILTSTISFIVIYGIWKNGRHKNLDGYIKGSSTARWWTVGLSVMATQASAITFLSTPGQAFHDGMGFVQFYFGLPFAMIIICVFFIPIYNKLKVFTAYQFLENRFDRKTRKLTAILFLIQRGLAAGITIYAPAIILSVLLNWNLKILIIIIGIIVTTYTLIGGTKTVSITHKHQMILIFSGLIITFFYIINSFPEKINFFESLKIAKSFNKLNIIDFSIDPNNRYTFWSGLTGGLFLALSYFGADQSQVQRYLSARSLKESQIGLIMNGFLKVPMQFFILLIGVMVFIFYQFETAPINFNPEVINSLQISSKKNSFETLQKENIVTQKKIKEYFLTKYNTVNKNRHEIDSLFRLEKSQREKTKIMIKSINPKIETNDKDYIFISYILSYFPKGLIGLLIAVIICASMSSTASELNALASTTVIDIYKNDKQKSDLHYVKATQIFTLIWGIIAIFYASVGMLFENLIQLVNIIGSIFYGTILGVFISAIFIKKIKSKAVFYSAIISEIIIIIIFFIDIISFLWLNFIGAVLTILIAFLIQLLIKESKK